MMKRTLCLAIIGPSASGKSALAMKLAEPLGGEILCLDSTTVYRGFNIGSAKPSPSDQKKVKHHLIDILEPEADFSAGEFVRKAEVALEAVSESGKMPILVGGTYFYLRALQHGMYPQNSFTLESVEAIEKEFATESELPDPRLQEALRAVDPISAEKIHANDRYRLVRALAYFRSTGKPASDQKPVPLSEHAGKRLWLKYALAIPRHQLSAAIVERTDKMLSQGLVEETRLLRENHPSARALGTIGYAEAVKFLDKQIDQTQMRNEIIEKTRQLAKRQMTWLRSDPEVRFIDSGDLERIQLEISNLKKVLG